MDVPTAVSFSSLQQTAEQIIDIPVPRGRGGSGGGGLQGYRPGQGWRNVEQLIGILVPDGGPQDFPPGGYRSRLALEPTDAGGL